MRKIKFNNIKEGIIIDIREKEDYNISHLPQSINFPLSYLKQNYKSLLNKKIRYYLICYTGKSSNTLSKELRKENYKVYIIKGGYESIKKL